MSKQSKSEQLYYTPDALLGHNAMLNMVMSARGNGKTFAFKKKALSVEHQTMWVRRYSDDLPEVQNTFMTDLYREGLFTDRAISVRKNRLIMDGETKVIFVGLSTSFKKKSTSYADVDMIVFDEFIESRRNRNYLPDEVTMFLDLIETVNRLRLDRPEVRVFMLANRVTFANPYFEFWHIKPFEQRFQRFQGGLLVVENYSNELYKRLKHESRFGRLVEGTKYSKYAIDNETLWDNDAFIRAMPGDAKHLCNIRYSGIQMGLWTFADGLYLCDSYNMERLSYAERGDTRERELPLVKNQPPVTGIRKAVECCSIFFSDILVKGLCMELLNDPLNQ